mmetsp:Transcript_9155/g.20658  ORF Transcript_9155/g.20658 Transcript_9155/m.20658 type:complete len:88 (+) Transcript_9155:745-1008(+)
MLLESEFANDSCQISHETSASQSTSESCFANHVDRSKPKTTMGTDQNQTHRWKLNTTTVLSGNYQLFQCIPTSVNQAHEPSSKSEKE